MNKIIQKELSYKITGLCFLAHKELGRFCREKQYADRLEELFKKANIKYKREFEIKEFTCLSPKGNKVDFLVEEKIIIDAKVKKFITKEDYIQMQRYLKCANLELGMIVNFRDSYLKPKRVLNSSYSGYNHSGHSDIIRGFGSIKSDPKSQIFPNDPNFFSGHSDIIRGFGSEGYITLISVLIVSAIGVAITVSLLLLGLGSSRTSFVIEQSNQAKALTNACAEEALQQIRDSNPPFTGSGNLTLGQGTCAYTATSQGQNSTITATGTVNTIIRKSKIIIDKINPAINIVSWQEE